MKFGGEELSVTQEGHLEVAVHAPRLPFGSLHTENITPVFQCDGVYGINSGLVTTSTALNGTATTSNSSFSISTGTTQYAQAGIQSRKRLRYRPGQGVIGRFTATFSTPASQSYQVVGFGHSEDGVYFGYKNTTFGILYNVRGVREVQTLTVTVGATVSSNVTITLNDVAFTVPVTNASNVQRTVYEIATYASYTGWKAEPRGATVVFVADAVGNKTGAFTFGAGTTNAAASFSETMAGVAATETFIPQSSWNGDRMDGTDESGYTLDPSKGNVYQIHIQYLGYGPVVFQVEIPGDGANNSEFATVHSMNFPNTLTATTFGNPSFPFTMAVYSAGSTTNLTVTVGSFAGFIEGHKMLHGNRFSYFNQLTSVGANNYQAFFTILNTRYYGSRTNQAVINLKTVSAALKHTSPCIFYLIKNGTLAGNPNFTQYATNSCSYVDTAATTVTFSTNDQLIWTGHLGDTGDIDHHFNSTELEELTLQPGEWVTLAAKSVTGSPSYATGSMNTREDQ